MTLVCGHPARRPGCPVCTLARHPRNAALFAAPGGTTPAPLPVVAYARGRPASPGRPAARRRVELPCFHRGPDLTGPERQARGLSHQRRWLHCGNGYGPVCPCLTCHAGCPGYRPDPDAGTTRHVLYHCLPVRRWGNWKRTADRLRASPLFNGRKVAAVLTDAGAGISVDNGRVIPGDGWDLEPWEVVRDYLGAGWDVFPVPNDPTLREVATWVPLWSKFADLAGESGHAAFYCHSKGVRHSPALAHLHDWTRVMAAVCLDHWPAVRRALRTHPIVGAFKKPGRGWAESPSAWHYSGTFFWADLADFLGRDWRGVERFWSGAESYPGVAYHPSEGACLFHEAPVGTLEMYDPRYVGRVLAEFDGWKAAHAGDRTDPAPLGIGVVTYNRLPLLQRCVAAVRRHTAGPYTLVVADDGSTDGTAAWCRAEGIPVVTGDNRGCAWNKNRALHYLAAVRVADPLLLIEDDALPNRDGWDREWAAATRRWGHVNAAPGGDGTADAPGWADVFFGSVTGTSRAALAAAGYLDTRFTGYGYEHVEWTWRVVRDFGRAAGWPPDRVPCMAGGVAVTADGGSFFPGEAGVAANRRVYDAIRDDPAPRPPAHTAELIGTLAAEVAAALAPA